MSQLSPRAIATRLNAAASSACPAIPDTMPQNAPECPIPEINSHAPTERSAVPDASPPSPNRPDTSSNRDLTPQQLLAAALLAVGHSDSAVIQKLSIDRKTLYRWKHHNPLFQSHLSAAISDLWDTAASRIRSSLLRAVNELNRQMKDEDKLTRYRAARTFLTSAAARSLAPAAPIEPTQILDELLAAQMNRQFPGLNCPAHSFPQHLRDRLLQLLLSNHPLPHPDTFYRPVSHPEAQK